MDTLLFRPIDDDILRVFDAYYQAMSGWHVLAHSPYLVFYNAFRGTNSLNFVSIMNMVDDLNVSIGEEML